MDKIEWTVLLSFIWLFKLKVNESPLRDLSKHPFLNVSVMGRQTIGPPDYFRTRESS